MAEERIRLDAALADRGIARSRTHAQQLIEAGVVTINGRGVIKASTKVTDDDEIDAAGVDHYVSRAAHKLLAALEAFDVDPTDRVALDLGASTGGFTQVLLERGAAHVTALDVGHGQFALDAADERITLVEGRNVRDIEAGEFDPVPDLVTADLSFISLDFAIAPVRGAVAAASDWLVLVKPQFEVGRQGVRQGLVPEAARRAEAIEGVLWAAWDAGLGTAGLAHSPIMGQHGNREYLAWLSEPRGENPTEWLESATRLAHDA